MTSLSLVVSNKMETGCMQEEFYADRILYRIQPVGKVDDKNGYIRRMNDG